MHLPIRVLECEGCGRLWALGPTNFISRIKRCHLCPPPPPGVPDLQSQFESLLDEVWKDEANWRFDDRIDLAMKQRRLAP